MASVLRVVHVIGALVNFRARALDYEVQAMWVWRGIKNGNSPLKFLAKLPRIPDGSSYRLWGIFSLKNIFSFWTSDLFFEIESEHYSVNSNVGRHSERYSLRLPVGAACFLLNRAYFFEYLIH